MQTTPKENGQSCTRSRKQSQGSRQSHQSSPTHTQHPSHSPFGPHGPLGPHGPHGPPGPPGHSPHGADIEFVRGATGGPPGISPRLGPGPPVGMMDPDVSTMLAEWVERGPPLVAAVLDERNRLLHSAGRHNHALTIELDSAQRELSRLRSENNRLRSTTNQTLLADLDTCRSKLDHFKRTSQELEARLRDISVTKLRTDHSLAEALEERDAARKRLERLEECAKDAMERIAQSENKTAHDKLDLLGKNVGTLISQKDSETRRADRAARRANCEANRAERESKLAAQEQARGREEKARADRQAEHANELMTKLVQAQNKVHDLTQAQRWNERKLMEKASEKNTLTLPTNVDDKVRKELVAVLKEPQFVKLFLDLIESWKASKMCLSTVLGGKEGTKQTGMAEEEPIADPLPKSPPGASEQTEAENQQIFNLDVAEAGDQRNEPEAPVSENSKNDSGKKKKSEEGKESKKKKKGRKEKNNPPANGALAPATRISKRKKKNKTLG